MLQLFLCLRLLVKLLLLLVPPNCSVSYCDSLILLSLGHLVDLVLLLNRPPLCAHQVLLFLYQLLGELLKLVVGYILAPTQIDLILFYELTDEFFLRYWGCSKLFFLLLSQLLNLREYLWGVSFPIRSPHDVCLAVNLSQNTACCSLLFDHERLAFARLRLYDLLFLPLTQKTLNSLFLANRGNLFLFLGKMVLNLDSSSNMFRHVF